MHNKKDINVLITESIDLLYQMLLLVNEMYSSHDPNFSFGDYIVAKLNIEQQLDKFLQL